ncbi:MAG: hypothetical protein PHT78_13300, partial [Desulfitobacteriaceae bacterium]|nr:hypothetical protein [Desulfitobacteriaceae bacterium]
MLAIIFFQLTAVLLTCRSLYFYFAINRGVEYTDEDIEQMEESYKEFEKELVKIEDDRKFRLEAIKWLDT